MRQPIGPGIVLAVKREADGATVVTVLPITHSRPHDPAEIISYAIWLYFRFPLSLRMVDRAENSHQPTRRRERIMKRFKSPRQVQRFLSAHDQVANIFPRRRDHDTAANLRSGRTQAFATWAEVTGVAMAA